MTYTIQQKEKRPAGDWLITAVNEEGKGFHRSFATEPTDEEVNQMAEKHEVDYAAAMAELEADRLEEEARLAAEEAEE